MKAWLVFSTVVACFYIHFDQTLSCQICENFGTHAVQGYKEIHYRLSNEKVENPRRGFMSMSSCGQNYPCALSVAYLNGLRQTHGITIVGRQYVLYNFKSSDISCQFLQGIRTELSNVRAAGFTVVLRFTYTTTSGDSNDATVQWAVRHISQLKPILTEYQDIIDVVQAGLIGTWGEWYYSANYGQPSSNSADYGLTTAQWNDRRTLFLALLNDVPSSIQVQIRTPNYKMQILSNNSPTTWNDVQQKSNKARTGHHNDCFLASASDLGTYRDVTTEYPYLEADTQYCAMGGETCPPTSNRHHCVTAKAEMKRFHWSYLNIDYDQNVYNVWKAEGCFDDVHRRLGYRLVVTKALLPESARGQFCFAIHVRNDGFAAPYRPLDVDLVLKATSGGNYFSAHIPDVEVRQWQPGQDHVISGGVQIPSDITPGNYKVYLVLSEAGMASQTDYNVLLANIGVPVYSEGLNDLLHTIQIQDLNGQCSDVSCPALLSWSPPTHSQHSRLFGPIDTQGIPSSPLHLCKKISIPNRSFETNSDWSQFGTSGFVYVTSSAYEGQRSAEVTNGGCLQIFNFEAGVKKLIVSAYSKNSGVTGSDGPDYAIYCDLQHTDNTWTYGQTAPFKTGSAGNVWHRAILYVSTQKDIAEAYCYGMFRNYNSGTAFFDTFDMWTMDSSIDFSYCSI